MHLSFPLRVGVTGALAKETRDDWVRGLIEQVLFTSPGERVMRPDFGCGLMKLVFDPKDEATLIALRFMIEQNLQLALGEQLEDLSVEVMPEDSGRLLILVRYLLVGADEASESRHVA
ncbi:MAG: GPW/gp25 family protein [Alphaproteobacteria bacterium]|nr:GPW/gp25 family protein [Alphaproteobacteria bacterium]